MRTFDVHCPSCKQNYHETTKHFSSKEKPHGAMFTLKPKFKANQWSSFPEEPYIVGGRLECPGCGCLYAGHQGELIATLVEHADEKNERYLAVRALRKKGLSYRAIGEELGISKSLANRIDKKHIGRKKPC